MTRTVRGGRIDLAALFLALAAIAAFLHPAGTRPLTWDEVDYVVAAREGAWANLTDRGAMGPVTFARYALAKAGRGDAQGVADAAGYADDANLLALRHWHPPAGFLPLGPAVAVAGPERGARLMQLAWAVVLAGLLFLMLRDLAPASGVLRGGALLLAMVDPLTRSSLLEAHVHAANAVAFLLPVWAWIRATRDPIDARRLGALREAARTGPPTARMGGMPGAFLMGLALGVLCSAAVVGPLWTVAWIAFLSIHGDARDWLGRERGWRFLVAGAVAALLLFWPGAFLKVSLVQTYALRAYAVLFQGGREWGGVGGALLTTVRRDPALVLYAGLVAAALVAGAIRGRRDALGAGAAGVAFLAVIAPFAIIDRYLLPLVPLAAVSAVALLGPGDAERDPGAVRRRTAGALAGVTLLLWVAGSGFAYPDRLTSEALEDEYARVDRLASRGVPVLAEGGHVFRFYGPDAGGMVRPILVDYDGRRLIERRGVRYDTVAIDRPAWIVLQRRVDAPEPPVMAELGARCRREDHATHVHFACGGVEGGEPYATVTVRPRGAGATR